MKNTAALLACPQAVSAGDARMETRINKMYMITDRQSEMGFVSEIAVHRLQVNRWLWRVEIACK